MGINRDYTRFTYQELLTDFRQRLSQDERFKDISSASLFSMFMEMLASTVDMTNYYIARTSEESFIDSARLDSSLIKLAKNFGYIHGFFRQGYSLYTEIAFPPFIYGLPYMVFRIWSFVYGLSYMVL